MHGTKDCFCTVRSVPWHQRGDPLHGSVVEGLWDPEEVWRNVFKAAHITAWKDYETSEARRLRADGRSGQNASTHNTRHAHAIFRDKGHDVTLLQAAGKLHRGKTTFVQPTMT